MFPSDSAEDALEKILAMMDRRFIKVEDEKRRSAQLRAQLCAPRHL